MAKRTPPKKTQFTIAGSGEIPVTKGQMKITRPIPKKLSKK
jgi:hypothetical protein